MVETLGSVSGVWLEGIVNASWQGALLALLVLGVLRLAPGVSPRLRAAALWLVCLRFAIAALVPLGVALPMKAPVSPSVATPFSSPTVVWEVVPRERFAPLEPRLEAPAPPGPLFERTPVPWTALVFAIWLAGACVAFVRLERQRQALRLRLEDGVPLGEGRVLKLAQALAATAGLPAPPPLFVSHQISAPMVVGLGRPRIVLPSRSIETLDQGSLRMALAHELAHVLRRDLWLGWVPAIADALFWFLPLVRLCAREFAQAREEACDADALALTGASPAEYGQLLIAFGVAHRGAGAHAACGASPHFQHLRRRLIMLQHVSSSRSRWWSLAAVMALPLLIPFRVVAKESPAAATAPASPRAPQQVTATRPTTPAKPAAPATPRASHSITHLNPGSSHGDAYVYVDGENSTMSGNTQQLRAARALRGKYGDRFVWVRRAGKSYVIDDPASLAKLDPLLAQERALGDQQTALGNQQSALGDKQSALGTKQSALGDTMSKLGEQQGALAVTLADGQESDADRARSEALTARMEAAGGKMNALGQKMEALGAQMDALGTRMDALGQKMEAVSHDFERALDQVTTDAISRGVAHPVD